MRAPRAGRQTNLLLLAVLASAFLTGAMAQALGTPSVGGWMAALHGVAGLTVLLLAPPKTKVARRGLARPNPSRAPSLLLAALAVVVVATGVMHAAGWRAIGGLTTLWVHVVTALALIPLLGWHYFIRKTRPHRTDLSRRNALRLAGLAAVGSAIWWTTERGTALAGLPGAERRFTGSHEQGSFQPAAMPVTYWLNDRPPPMEGSRLLVADAAGVREPELAELDDGAEEVEAVLDCTSGWFSRQVWRGVRLDRLVEPGSARSLRVSSLTGYWRLFPVSDLDRLWLASLVGGEPLSLGHGYPLRLVAPGRRGFWWVKWVVRVETSDSPWWLQPPFPLS